MKIKMNLKTKMLLYILIASSIIYALALGYVSLKLNNIAYDNAKKLTNAYAKEYANYTKADISVDMNMVRSIGQISEGYKTFPPDRMIEMFNGILESALVENPHFLATFYNWELSAIWPDWKKPYGRMRLTYYKAIIKSITIQK